DRSRCNKLVHGVAFLCGISTPSLAAQGEQRRSVYFNINRDNSRSQKRRPVHPQPQVRFGAFGMEAAKGET
ncbi:MAG: hypothetical protein ACLQFW_20180, partial [Xanthobacteraceae bacterium]